MAESALQGGDENRAFADNPLPRSDVCNFISREDDNKSPDKTYGDGTSEMCATKLDERKIDDYASDYHERDTCVSSSCRYERATRNKSHERTVKSDHVPSRDRDESRCRSNGCRRKRTHCQTPEGIVIDLSNNVAGTKRSGIEISVISVHNLAADTRFIAIPKRGPASKRGLASKQRARSRSSTRDSRRKEADKAIGGSVLAVFYTENRGGTGKTGRSVPSGCKSRQRAARYERIGSTNKMPRPDVDAIAHTAHQSGHALNERQELRAADNSRPFCASDEICDSMKCCHRDAALFEADNQRCSISSAGQAYAISHSAEPCCLIFNEQHQEYHVCEEEDYNAGTSDFNAEAQADWMSIGCIHAACAHAKGCRCFCDSCRYYSSINMQLHRCHSIPMRVMGLLKNSDPPERLQREEIERFGSSCELQAASVAPEFATGADEYSLDGVGSGRCASYDEVEAARSSASTTRKCTASKASVFVEAGGSVDNLGYLRGANALSREIEADPEESKRHTTMLAEKEDDAWLRKSDSSRGGFVDTRATTGDCIGRCCESPIPDRSPGMKGRFARGVDPKWVRDSIETDAQQLDYKWKRRIATIDDGARASVDFKGKRDSRYKSEEAIRVQLRERVEIRKRESLQMVEATSQTRRDNTNADGKRRDYSLWTSLQMGKIWSQVHDACRNVAKLAATSISRLARDPAKSECSRRNPQVEVADATHLVGSSSSHADGMCGEACRGNVMRSKTSEKSEAREEERAINDAAGTHEDIKISKQKKPRTPSERNTARKRAYANPGKMENEKSCVFHERERDGYRDVVELLPRNETYGHDEAAYPQSRLSGSFTYLKDSAYPGFRNRGGSDDNRDFARSIEDKRSEARRRTNDIEETGSIGHQNSVSETCVCHAGSQTCMHCIDSRSSSLHAIVSHERLSATPSDVSDVSRNSSHHELQSVAVSSPETGEQTLEAYMNSTDLQTERNPMPETVGVVEARVSSTEIDTAVHSSRNDPDEPIASTSTWQPPFISSRESQTSRASGSRSRGCATAMRFWRRRQPAASNKAIAPVFKRKIRSAGKKKLLSATTILHDSETKITQIKSSTVQTAGESNKRRTYVNVRMQTSGAIVTRILSKLLVGGEKAKGVLMTIMLQSESNDVSDRKEAETQTPSNDVTSVGTDAFDWPDRQPDRHPPTMIGTRTVQCFVCDKPDCYEMKRSDDSITLEEALIEEYPEETLGRNDIAKGRTVVESPL